MTSGDKRMVMTLSLKMGYAPTQLKESGDYSQQPLDVIVNEFPYRHCFGIKGHIMDPSVSFVQILSTLNN